MTYLLDTHAALWLLEGNPRLSTAAREAIGSEPGGSVALSDISLLEIAMLERRRVIGLGPDLEQGLKSIAEQLIVLPITARIAANAVNLSWQQKDPFDRVIAATARIHRLTLLSKDGAITRSGAVPILWD